MEQTVFEHMPSLLVSTPNLEWGQIWPACLKLPPIQLSSQNLVIAQNNPTPILQLNQMLGFKSKNDQEANDSSGQKEPMKITKCPHTNKKHYAKNMCNTCYHTRGRNNIAFKCEHADKQNYAKGYCFNCYFIEYKKQKKGQIRKIF